MDIQGCIKKRKWKWQSLSHVQLFATLWTVALPGSTIRGILQARMLKWVAIPFAGGSSQPRDWIRVSQHCKQILYCLSHQGRQRLYKFAVKRQYSICNNTDKSIKITEYGVQKSGGEGWWTQKVIRSQIFWDIVGISRLCLHSEWDRKPAEYFEYSDKILFIF